MDPATVKLAAAGRAYQSVAQSSAIAIQDATDYLRSISTISATAIGVGIAMVVANKGDGAAVIQQGQAIATTAVTQFAAVGTAAAKVATEFSQTIS